MDVHRLAQKLEPLMPERMVRWRRLRDQADSDVRVTLDKQLVALARQRLGDPRRRPFLSLPPNARVAGTFEFGTVLYDRSYGLMGVSAGELLQNLAIFGRSGAGKTNALLYLLEQLDQRRVPFLFLDWKRTGRHFLPRLDMKRTQVFTPGRSVAPFSFNPFRVPDGVEPQVYTNHIVDVLADAYTLGDGARSLLQRVLHDLYSRNTKPTPEAILQALNAIPDRERVRTWKISAIRALESIVQSRLCDDHEQSTSSGHIEHLLRNSTILELDGLSANAKKFLIPLLCFSIYASKMNDRAREQLSFVIVVEEAHHVLHRSPHHARESVLEMLMRQCRELGIAMIVVDQHPHLISPAVLGNTFAAMFFNLKDPRDVRSAAAITGLDEEDRHWLQKLPVGQAIVRLQDRWTEPVLVQVPHMAVDKGRIDDEALHRLQHPSFSRSDRETAVKREFEGVRRIRSWDPPLREEEMSLMHDVLSHPRSPVRDRYRRLRWSVDKGHRIKETLVQRGWLEGETIAHGRTRTLILRPSREARERLGLEEHSSRLRQEGIAHAFWKDWYARRLSGWGYSVRVESPRVGGAVDLLAKRDGRTIGIEIETGKSDFVENVRNGLRSRFDQVVIIVTDESACSRIEQTLARENLLIPNRVTVWLRDRWTPATAESSATLK